MCIEGEQTDRVLEEFHDGFLGGHYSTKDNMMKILKEG